eukprot:g16465.t1
MKRKAPKNILVTIALRLLPLVSLPLLVAVLQPDSDAGEGWKMILVGAACGVVISAAVPSLRIALLAVAIVTVLLLSVAYTEALHHQLHLGNDHDEPRPPRPMLLQEKSDVASAAAALPLDVERKRLAAQEVAALRWRPAPPKIEAPVEMATFSVVLPCAFEGEFAEKTEIPGGGGGKVCFILWNNDFTWLYNPGRDAPLMSGGLLALSRRWWEETGGYDTKMVAWGGENIDQSLRSIEVADGAFVAHMWRDPKNPKTVLRYPIPTKDVMRNKARAATAWFGEFTEKVMTFPEYEMFTKNGETIGDMSEFGQLKQKLGCAPFASYLDRFSYIYLDGGLLPAEVFQLREKKTGLCLHVKRNDRAPHNVVLAACAGHHEEHQSSELQLFHRGNRDQSKRGKPCCSGIMHWNFLQCLDAQRVGMQVSTFECFEIKVGETGYCLDSGGGSQALVYPCYDEKVHNMNQVWKIRDGRLLWESGGRVICVDSEKIQEKVKAPQGEYRLVTCAPKPGQRLKREEIDSQGTFLLKDQDDGRCLSALSGNVLGLSECTAKQRWRVLAANGFHQPGWIQNPLTWGDNGRRRSFESCLDRLPTQHQSVAVQECSEVRQAGVQRLCSALRFCANVVAGAKRKRSLRLSWIHALPGHAHPRLRIPLKRAPLAPLELRLGLCVLAPGDAAPHPCWMTERVTMPWVSATRPKAPEGVATRKVTALPLRSRLDFTMVSLWDLSLPQETPQFSHAVFGSGGAPNSLSDLGVICGPFKLHGEELSADDLLLDLSFRAEVATGEVDELVLLDTDVSEASNWRETFPAREGKAGAHQPAWLLVQVCLRQRSSSQVYFEGEACLPLMECWPPLGRFSLTGEDIREPGTELEEGCPGRFGKVPLFRTSSRSFSGIQQLKGVFSAFAIPGALGVMKCSYSLSRLQMKMAPDAEDGEEKIGSPMRTAPMTKPESAAKHTHDVGYQKWESFLEEKRRHRVRHTKVIPRVADSSSDDEEEDMGDKPENNGLLKLLDYPSTKLPATGLNKLFLGGLAALQSSLEVFLGKNLATVYHSRSSRSSGRSLLRSFHEKKELQIELPRHNRLELRLKLQGLDAAVIGSTVIDLQDRRLVESLRGKDQPDECRQLWSPQWMSQRAGDAGSLELWALIRPYQEELQLPQPWPRDLWPFRAEVRAILHEVDFVVPIAPAEVVALMELQMPFERLHRYVNFEWRFSFPLRTLRPSAEKKLVITLFDAKTWRLLGSAEQQVDLILDQVLEDGDRRDPPNREYNDIQVTGDASLLAHLRLTVCALPRPVAEDFPAPSGRSRGAVPPWGQTDPAAREQAFCAQQLFCMPPAVPNSRAARPPRAKDRRRAHRRWVARGVIALGLLSLAMLTKEHLIWRPKRPMGSTLVLLRRPHCRCRVWP